MTAPNRSPMRVLIRPPSSSPTPPPSTTTLPPPLPPPPLPPLPPPTPSRQNGVVVVGFIGRRKSDVSQLINRIVDDNVFGSGNADVALGFDKTGEISDEVKDWLKEREISYYCEEAKGVLYLQLCCSKCPVFDRFSEEVPSGFDSVFEKMEFGDLKGMLFMFSWLSGYVSAKF
ncbi:putative protein SMG8 [Helianthus annuus]|nr:putative protein SMG8 [Helianthus annuus]